MQNEALQKYIKTIPWLPEPGPQQQAMFSPADVVLFGGAAGGGKTSLACGMAVTRHEHSLIMRRESTQLKGIIREISEIIDPTRAGYSSKAAEWRIPRWDGVARTVMFGSCPNPGDEFRWQGIARDFLILDEAANFLESQAKFLMGWTRSTTQYPGGPGLHNKQRTRVIMCSNPPANAEGLWLKVMFAAWLDPAHPNPAAPGELRYYTTVAGVMEEQESGDPILNPDPVTEADKWIYPKSFTFIPSKVTDNKYLGADYIRELQALPEPLRSQMLYGDFGAGQEDSEWCVIPSAWVDEAQARWEVGSHDTITAVGVDPSRGGRDSTVLAARTGWHFHGLKPFPGAEMKTGGQVAAKVVELVGHSHCPVNVDVIGIGASAYDHLTPLIGERVEPINAASRDKEARDWTGNLSFLNTRAEMWWWMRDILNPANGFDVALPPDARLKAELCTPNYELMSTGIKIESKQDIVKRLGHSTDYADAVCLAAIKAPSLNIRSTSPANTRIRVSR